MNNLVDISEQEKENVQIGNISSIGSILDNKEPTNKQKFLAECIGTLLLIFICCGSAVFTDFEIVPSAIGGSLIVTSLVYLFQKVSGAHFNPVVSFPMFILKKISLKELFYYLVAQLLGAMLGSLLVGLCRRGKFDILASNQIGKYLINLSENKEIDAWCYISAFFCEVFLTFILIIVVLASTVQKNNFGNLTGLVVGFTIMFLIFTGFSISGCSLNPVRSLAPAFYEAVIGGNTTAIKQIWIYIFWPFFGGALATLVFFQVYN